jgi:hypothetical protein
VVREIKVDGLPSGGGALRANRITGKTQLEFYLGKKDPYEKILAQVDFKKEQLVLFRWTGSGQDKIEMKKVKDGLVTFTFLPGDTNDRKAHAKLFALPLKTEYKIVR